MIESLESLKGSPKLQIHIPATVLLDVQAIYPQHLVPKILRDASEWYISFSGDPLIDGAFHGGQEFNWFRAFLYLEACVKQGSFHSRRRTDKLPFLGFSNYRYFSSPRGRCTPVHPSHRLTTRSCSPIPLRHPPRRSLVSPSSGRPPALLSPKCHFCWQVTSRSS